MGESIPIMGLAGSGSKLRTAIGPAKLAGQLAVRSTGAQHLGWRSDEHLMRGTQLRLVTDP